MRFCISWRATLTPSLGCRCLHADHTFFPTRWIAHCAFGISDRTALVTVAKQSYKDILITSKRTCSDVAGRRTARWFLPDQLTVLFTFGTSQLRNLYSNSQVIAVLSMQLISIQRSRLFCQDLPIKHFTWASWSSKNSLIKRNILHPNNIVTNCPMTSACNEISFVLRLTLQDDDAPTSQLT